MSQVGTIIGVASGAKVGVGAQDGTGRELITYYPVFWFFLPEGPEREALKRQQETSMPTSLKS